MHEVHEQSQAIGEFLEDFLAGKGVLLATRHEHNDTCYHEGLTKQAFQEKYRPHKPGVHPRSSLFWESDEIDEEDWEAGRHSEPKCGIRTGALLEFNYRTEMLLAEFFGIDLKKVEAERRAILAELEKQNAKKT